MANTIFAQEYFTQSKSELIKLKSETIKKEEFLKASKISAEIKFRDSLYQKIQLDKKEKALAVKKEDFSKAELLKKEISKNQSYDILRKELKNALAKENYSKAEEVKSKLMILRYSQDIVKTKTSPQKTKISRVNNNISSETALLIINNTKYIFDVLIDSMWVGSLGRGDSVGVQNIDKGNHKMELAVAGLNNKKKIPFEFSYDGSPLKIEFPFNKSAFVVKTRNYASKEKEIKNKEKSFYPIIDNSVKNIPNTSTNFDIDNPTYKKREINKPMYNYQNIYFDIPYYFTELPADATGKIKFDIGLETINNFKSFNGLFWGVGYSFYMLGYTQNSQYLDGAYLYINNTFYDASYYSNAQLPFSMYLINITGSFGYLYEPNDYIGLYSSFRVIPSFSFGKTSTLQTYTDQSGNNTYFGAKVNDESYFNVNFGASINAGAMFFPFGKNTSYGISTEALLYLGGGVNVGFNLGLSYRILSNKKLRYRYYQ
jgi:sRNA-binding carbon storage regulator CsrA